MQLYQLKFPNDKSYIGITSKTAEERFKQHCKLSLSKKRYAVHAAIRKYGKENVVLTVLDTVDNWELLCLAEMEAIEKFNTFMPNGYNLTLGGDGTQTVGIYGAERIARDKEVKLEKAKSYRIANTEKLKQKSLDYYKLNADVLNKKKIIYRKNNSDYIRVRRKKYYKSNVADISQKSLDYYKLNADVLKKRSLLRYYSNKYPHNPSQISIFELL